MKNIAMLCLLALTTLLGGCDKPEAILDATLVARESSGFQAELPSGQRVVCPYHWDSPNPPQDAAPGTPIKLSTRRLYACVQWYGPVKATGKVVATQHTAPIEGKQYIAAFTVELPSGQLVACPVNTTEERIPKPEGTSFFGEVTRWGCRPI